MMSTRGEILYQFAMQEEMSHEDLRVHVMFYPELKDDLCEIFRDRLGGMRSGMDGRIIPKWVSRDCGPCCQHYLPLSAEQRECKHHAIDWTRHLQRCAACGLSRSRIVGASLDKFIKKGNSHGKKARIQEQN